MNQLRYPEDEPLLWHVYRGLYLKSFPRQEEREDWDDWRLLLGRDGHGTALVLRQRLDNEEPRTAGFALVEFYPESRCGLLSYIAIEAEFRRRGYGRELVAHGVKALTEHASRLRTPLRAVFAEIHDPSAQADGDVMDAEDRVGFFAQLGARRVPIPYVQPDLGHGYGPVPLWLIALPLDGSLTGVRGKDVRRFVRELYAIHPGAEVSQLHQMERELPTGWLCLDSLRPLSAAGLFEFGKYSVVLHFVAHHPDDKSPLPESTADYASFDRDILAYAYRNNPPFSNRQFDVPDELREVRLRFSPQTRFVSEGCAYRLVEEDQRYREVLLSASVTHFKSGVDVYHLAMTPGASAAAPLTEYDLIRIAKLWEGGEEVEGCFNDEGGDTWIRFIMPDGKSEVSTSELARRLFGESTGTPSLRTGTIELVTTDMKGPADWSAVWRAVKQLKSADASTTFPKTGVQDAVEAVAGILQGLLDFNEIDEQELSDVFDGAEVGRHGLQGLHKGTLLSVLDEDRALDVGLRSVGASPYLVVPHAVLVHNEEILRACASDDIARHSHQWRQTRWSPVRKTDLLHLQARRAALRRALDREYVPNVFHYPNERWIYERGHTGRGLREHEQDVRSQLAETEARCELAAEHRRRKADDARNALLLVLTFTALHAIIHTRNEDWIVVATLSMLALVYLVSRR